MAIPPINFPQPPPNTQPTNRRAEGIHPCSTVSKITAAANNSPHKNLTPLQQAIADYKALHLDSPSWHYAIEEPSNNSSKKPNTLFYTVRKIIFTKETFEYFDKYKPSNQIELAYKIYQSIAHCLPNEGLGTKISRRAFACFGLRNTQILTHTKGPIPVFHKKNLTSPEKQKLARKKLYLGEGSNKTVNRQMSYMQNTPEQLRKSYDSSDYDSPEFSSNFPLAKLKCLWSNADYLDPKRNQLQHLIELTRKTQDCDHVMFGETVYYPYAEPLKINDQLVGVILVDNYALISKRFDTDLLKYLKGLVTTNLCETKRNIQNYHTHHKLAIMMQIATGVLELHGEPLELDKDSKNDSAKSRTEPNLADKEKSDTIKTESQSIAHRDIKLENTGCFLSPDNKFPDIVIFDPDYSHDFSQNKDCYGSKGSPIYTAPELVFKKPPIFDKETILATDIFSLGVLLTILDRLIIPLIFKAEYHLKLFEDVNDNNRLKPFYSIDKLHKFPSEVDKPFAFLDYNKILDGDKNRCLDHLLYYMLHHDPQQRPNAKQVVDYLDYLLRCETMTQPETNKLSPRTSSD